jgi:hypothetical protein
MGWELFVPTRTLIDKADKKWAVMTVHSCYVTNTHLKYL